MNVLLFLNVNARHGAGINETIVDMLALVARFNVGVTCEFHPGLFLDAIPGDKHQDIMDQFEQYHGAGADTATLKARPKRPTKAAINNAISKVQAALSELRFIYAVNPNRALAANQAIHNRLTEIQSELEEWKG